MLLTWEQWLQWYVQYKEKTETNGVISCLRNCRLKLTSIQISCFHL